MYNKTLAGSLPLYQIIQRKERKPCQGKTVSDWLWLDLQHLLVRPLLPALHYDLRAMPHGQQPAHLLIQGLVLSILPKNCIKTGLTDFHKIS